MKVWSIVCIDRIVSGHIHRVDFPNEPFQGKNVSRGKLEREPTSQYMYIHDDRPLIIIKRNNQPSLSHPSFPLIHIISPRQIFGQWRDNLWDMKSHMGKEIISSYEQAYT